MPNFGLCVPQVDVTQRPSRLLGALEWIIRSFSASACSSSIHPRALLVSYREDASSSRLALGAPHADR